MGKIDNSSNWILMNSNFASGFPLLEAPLLCSINKDSLPISVATFNNLIQSLLLIVGLPVKIQAQTAIFQI